MKLTSFFRLAVACGILLGCLACGGNSSKDPITVKTDKDSIPMGHSIMVTAHINIKAGESPKDILLLPYVNQRRWGSHERPIQMEMRPSFCRCPIRVTMKFRSLP